MSKELKLRVGGKYLDRRNRVVEIVEDDGTEVPFRGSNLYWYKAGGQSYDGYMVEKEKPYDLVSEVKAKKSELKLKVGGVYRNCLGERVEIVKKDSSDNLPYLGDNGVWYSESGDYPGMIENRDARGRFCKEVQPNLVNEVFLCAKPDYKNSAAVEPRVEETAQASWPEGGNSYDRGDTVRLCRGDMIALAKMIAKAMKEVGE